MEKISDYTITCTEEQTKKALNLGAPIEYKKFKYHYRGLLCEKDELIIPTAEQMIGWLEEQEGFSNICVLKTMEGNYYGRCYCNGNTLLHQIFPSRKEATLAAIDAALEYYK